MPDQSQQSISSSWVFRKLHSGDARHQRPAASQQFEFDRIEIRTVADHVHAIGEVGLFERRVDADEIATQPRIEFGDGIVHSLILSSAANLGLERNCISAWCNAEVFDEFACEMALVGESSEMR